ncbi:MAG TPA: hypothetical protein VNO32_09950 [Candidatus Acidoferrum sp.]|nr:hypothetical protein [Candidatus Acidoferrum sp.]
MTKQELMDALLAESVLKLDEGREIVSVSQAIAVAEQTNTLAEWREAVEQMVKAGLDAKTKSPDSATLFSRAIADARALKEQYLKDPYRSPAKCDITSYWYYQAETREMTVPAQEGDSIAPEDFKQRFSQARQIAIGRGEGFVVGFLEEFAPNGGKITVGIWRAAFSSRFSEPIHLSKRQKFLIDGETDEIAWTVGPE